MLITRTGPNSWLTGITSRVAMFEPRVSMKGFQVGPAVTEFPMAFRVRRVQELLQFFREGLALRTKLGTDRRDRFESFGEMAKHRVDERSARDESELSRSSRRLPKSRLSWSICRCAGGGVASRSAPSRRPTISSAR